MLMITGCIEAVALDMLASLNNGMGWNLWSDTYLEEGAAETEAQEALSMSHISLNAFS